MLLRDRETVTGTTLPDGELPSAPPYACEACGAGMQAGQDWCLECGTAAPGRLGARPGWRAAFTVVGVTLLLLVGAVAASYAALTGDAEREASKPSTGSGSPITAPTPGIGQPAPVSPGETGPGTKAPAAPPAAPATSGSQPPAATNSPQASAGASTSANTSGNSSSSNTGSTNTTTKKTDPNTIKISSAKLYDPAKRAGAEFGPAANAIDASARSVWDVTVPVDKEPLGVGLVLDLGAPYTLKSLTMSTPTPGFDVELYGTRSKKLPPDILDTRWGHFVDRSNYADGTSIDLKGKGDGKVRFVNLWFAEAGDATDPRVAIANVKVIGTK
jgi:hypothetical protein